ncbi:MAG: hypothetical protein JNL79_02105 [Myxococcales bacterium]|nr:hypothetical protein [Myxococcales bacterium]
MGKDLEPRRRTHDPGEVIVVAGELMEADRTRAEQADLHAIGHELGVPAPYVDRAVVELDRRRKRRSVAVVIATLVALGTVFVLTRRLLRPPPPVAAVSPEKSPRGLRVGLDLRHGVGAATSWNELAARGAAVTLVEQSIGDGALADLDVLVVLEARKNWDPSELDAVVRFVRSGHGLVIADLGWSWVTYDKRPLQELPANVLGSQLGFGFTNDVLGVPTAIDPNVLGGLRALTRATPWVPCGVTVAPERGRLLVRDAHLRPMIGVVDAAKGRTVAIGHAGLVVDNPALLSFAVALAAGR